MNSIVLSRRVAMLMAVKRLVELGLVAVMPVDRWVQLYAAYNYHEAPPVLICNKSLESVSNKVLEEVLQEYEFNGLSVYVSRLLSEKDNHHEARNN